jgi:hypothetical protein
VIMSQNRRKFPWLVADCLLATAPRAIPSYSEKEGKIRNDLMMEGLRSVLQTSKGGQTTRKQTDQAKIRRILLEEAYRDLSKHLRKTPTGANTVRALRKILNEVYGFDVSITTCVRDVEMIGTRKLRQS